MNHFQTLRKLYEQRDREHSFDWYVWEHHNHPEGFVFSTPDYFVMGSRLASKGYGPIDTWFVYAMAGDLSKVWSILPYDLPLVAWERQTPYGKKLHFYRANRIRALCSLKAIP